MKSLLMSLLLACGVSAGIPALAVESGGVLTPIFCDNSGNFVADGAFTGFLTPFCGTTSLNFGKASGFNDGVLVGGTIVPVQKQYFKSISFDVDNDLYGEPFVLVETSSFPQGHVEQFLTAEFIDNSIATITGNCAPVHYNITPSNLAFAAFVGCGNGYSHVTPGSTIRKISIFTDDAPSAYNVINIRVNGFEPVGFNMITPVQDCDLGNVFCFD